MTVLLLCKMKWDGEIPSFPDAGFRSFLDCLASLSSFPVVAGDWRRLSASGVLRVYCPRRREMLDMPLAEAALIHIYRLAWEQGSTVPLADKWLQLGGFLDAAEAYGVRVINQTATVRAGMSKRYLERLRAGRVPVVPTEFVPSSIKLAELLSQYGQGAVVIKPANGECGRMVVRLQDADSHVLHEMKRHCKEIAVQPFLSEILAGEKSLSFFGGAFAHAVLKLPTLPDFRANGRHTSAQILRYQPSTKEVDLAKHAIAEFGHPIDTCRVDLVGQDATACVMELEVIDPGHYCRLDNRHAARLIGMYKALL